MPLAWLAVGFFGLLAAPIAWSTDVRGTEGAGDAPDRAAYETAMARAAEARQLAAAAGSEWLAVEPLLQDARRAAEKGDWAKGIELATQARLLSVLGIKQGEYEALHWQDRVVR